MIEVWAPRAERMRVRRVRDDETTIDEHEMTRVAERTGWWQTDVRLADGERYGFAIGDDDRLRPDPRSRRQPAGVHPPSPAFDQKA